MADPKIKLEGFEEDMSILKSRAAEKALSGDIEGAREEYKVKRRLENVVRRLDELDKTTVKSEREV